MKSAHVVLFSGELSTKQVLDRESSAVHSFTVEAIDRGGRIGYTTVSLIITDTADSLPVFQVQEYEANIFSSAEKEAFVLQVKITTLNLK